MHSAYKNTHVGDVCVRITALGIGGERRKELCAVERSTEANA